MVCNRSKMAATVMATAVLVMAGACSRSAPPGVGVQQPAQLPAAAPTLVWIEAEDAASTNFPAAERNPFAPANAMEASLLSGGKWIGVQGERGQTLFAEYAVEVPRAAEYRLWCRKFWKHGPFRWRLDGGAEGAWRTCSAEMPLADSISLRRFVGVNWVDLGSVHLQAGKHVLRVELLEKTGAAALDCFALVDGPFHPNGPLRPGQKYDRAEEGTEGAGWFAFEPGMDPLTPTPMDLSRLNHKVAGEFGWARPRGKDVIFEREGKPTRFWGVTVCNDDYQLDDASADYLAARLAKMGVNLVRMHLDFEDQKPSAKLERIQYFVAAMKKRGIYTYIGFYCSAIARVREEWNLPELKTGSEVQAVLFAYPPMQELYKGWARCLFNTPNPHTGLTLGNDPAVLGIELMDEDNLTFWTFQPYDSVPEAVMRHYEKHFGDWAARKYGSVQKALEAWGPQKRPAKGTDDPAAGRLALYPASLLTGNGWAVNGRNGARASDQLQFMTEYLRGFWGEMGSWLRKQTGFGGLVVGTNWKTADERVLGPLDKYTLTACDATAENDYFGPEVHGLHVFPFTEGNAFVPVSALKTPMNPVLMQAQFDQAPHFWTEGTWDTPNRFRTEMPLLLAGYLSLQGMDGLALFTLERDWAPTLPKWPIQVPSCMGQFPAAALIYRTGMVREGPIVQHEALKLAELYQFKGSAFGKPMGLDAAQAAKVPMGAELDPNLRRFGSKTAVGSKTAEVSQGAGDGRLFDPLAFYAGRVTRTVGENPGAPIADARLETLIDRAGQKVTSATGELVYDYGRGLMVINAPMAQGINGFAGAAGTVQTADARFVLENEYGAAVLVALDGKPLATSAKMLLQVMSEDRNYGYQTRAATRPVNNRTMEVTEIVAVGYPPIMVRKFAGRVALLRPDAATLQAQPLDANGYRCGAALPLKDGALQLEPRTLYYLLEKR